MEINGKDVYLVAMKVFVRDGSKLLITHDVFGAWDIPGGRIKKDEFEKPLESVIERKIREELGDEFTYELGEPKVFFRVERVEHDVNELVRIFAVGYEAKYRGGKIGLGDHHDKFEWVDVADFRPEDYFEGGWLAGVKDYMEQL